jgi:hypothetical protein
MHGEGVTGFQAGRVGTGAWICDDGLAERPRNWSGQAASVSGSSNAEPSRSTDSGVSGGPKMRSSSASAILSWSGSGPGLGDAGVA